MYILNFLDLVIPGLREIAEKHDCQLIFDGFVPAVKYENKVIQLDYKTLEGYFKMGKYSDMLKYIKKIISRIKKDE